MFNTFIIEPEDKSELNDTNTLPLDGFGKIVNSVFPASTIVLESIAFTELGK
jgi:hypothetical protein